MVGDKETVGDREMAGDRQMVGDREMAHRQRDDGQSGSRAQRKRRYMRGERVNDRQTGEQVDGRWVTE